MILLNVTNTRIKGQRLLVENVVVNDQLNRLINSHNDTERLLLFPVPAARTTVDVTKSRMEDLLGDVVLFHVVVPLQAVGHLCRIKVNKRLRHNQLLHVCHGKWKNQKHQHQPRILQIQVANILIHARTHRKTSIQKVMPVLPRKKTLPHLLCLPSRIESMSMPVVIPPETFRKRNHSTTKRTLVRNVQHQLISTNMHASKIFLPKRKKVPPMKGLLLLLQSQIQFLPRLQPLPQRMQRLPMYEVEIVPGVSKVQDHFERLLEQAILTESRERTSERSSHQLVRPTNRHSTRQPRRP
mmetsp:Transcript_26858/g.48657  ORF Transcript_26858/g.48657 Transcript_26858/m.48657 type:complete len:297 (-) Transcript_26858:2005-2895(-)